MEVDFSRIVIKNQIGRGAYGCVYKGANDGKEVAIKIMDLGLEDEKKKSILLRVFMQEVAVWSSLDHPNIPKLIGATKTISDLSKIKGGHMPKMACCIVAEYVGGGTLASYLRRNRFRKLPMHLVIQLALDVAKGLSYLHSQKIVHRDVKTDNILLDKARRAKIIDFGVSRKESTNMTAQTGTTGYMAPEVLTGSPYDHKCDVFSFGICLWEIYCCARPNFRTSFRPEIPESCPSNLAKLMKECWDADAERRPEMAEVVRTLEAAMETTICNDQPKGCFCFF